MILQATCMFNGSSSTAHFNSPFLAFVFGFLFSGFGSWFLWVRIRLRLHGTACTIYYNYFPYHQVDTVGSYVLPAQICSIHLGIFLCLEKKC